MVQGSLPKACGSGRGALWKTMLVNAVMAQQDAERGNEHDQRRPSLPAHARVQAPVEGQADRPRQQARHPPAQVELRPGSVRNKDGAVRSQDRRYWGDKEERRKAAARREASIAPVERQARPHRNQHADCRTEHDVQLAREGEDNPHVSACARSQEASATEQCDVIETAPEPGVEGNVEGPRCHSGDHRGEHNVDVEVVDLVLAGQDLLRPQIKDAVGAHGGGRAVVHIEEPDSAVDEGEPHRQQSVYGTDGQAVEGELQGLVRGLTGLPGDVGEDRYGQYDR